MKVILISGKMGSGKTTLANNLVAALKAKGKTVEALKFAAPLYAMHDAVGHVAKQYGIPFDKKEGTLLQLLGTEWGRNLKGQDVWVNAVKHQIAQEWGLDYVLIDDARFENEFDAFPEAFSIRLEANEENRKARAEGWRPNSTHASETSLDQYAQQGKFTLTLDTNQSTPTDSLSIVLGGLAE